MAEATPEMLPSLNVPRSKIYAAAGPDADAPLAGTVKRRHKTDIADMHFFLILKCGELYTEDELTHCQGRYSCTNCGRKIVKEIYFYPERFDPQTNEPTCNPIPHCRTGCVYRTLQDTNNNADLLTNFFLMYGHSITCAPPRFLLFIPGGLTLEQYHQAMDEGVTYERQEAHIRMFFAPVFISRTVTKDHQLLENIVDYVDEMRSHEQKKSTVGMSKAQDRVDQQVVLLQPKSLLDTRLSQIFSKEPQSFARPGITGNPHMTAPLPTVPE